MKHPDGRSTKTVLDLEGWQIISFICYPKKHTFLVYHSKTEEEYGHWTSSDGEIRGGTCAGCGEKVPKAIVAFHGVLSKL